MTYTRDFPQGEISPKDQVTQVKTNFFEYDAKFHQLVAGINYNHGELNTSRQGLHEAVIYQNQTEEPDVQNDFPVIYGKDFASAAGTQEQLFIKIAEFLPNGIPNSPMMLTYNEVDTSGPIYQSFLLGGYLIFFGTVSSVGTPFALTPVPTKILTAMAPSNSFPSSLPLFTSVTITQPDTITINSSATGVFSISWAAICQA